MNKVLSKKGRETSDHVATLELGFQRLQETFRTTVLDSLEADAQLNDKIQSLERIVESLTVPHCNEEHDFAAKHAHKLNTFPRGKSKENAVSHNQSVCRAQSMTISLKRPEHYPSCCIRRKSKFKSNRRTSARSHHIKSRDIISS